MTEIPEPSADGEFDDAVAPLPSLAEARDRRRRRDPARLPEPPTSGTPPRSSGGRRSRSAWRKRDRRREPAAAAPTEPPPVAGPAPRNQAPEPPPVPVPVTPAPVSPPRPPSPARIFTGPPIPASRTPDRDLDQTAELDLSPLSAEPSPAATVDEPDSSRRLVPLATLLAVLAVGVTAVVTYGPFGPTAPAHGGATAVASASQPPTRPPVDPSQLPTSADEPKLPSKGDYLLYSWSTRRCLGQTDPETNPGAGFETALSSCDDERAALFLDKSTDTYRLQPLHPGPEAGGCVVPDGTGEGRGFRDGHCDREPREYYHLDDVHGDGFTDVFRIRTAEGNHCMTLDGTSIVQRRCAADDPDQQFVLKPF